MRNPGSDLAKVDTGLPSVDNRRYIGVASNVSILSLDLQPLAWKNRYLLDLNVSGFPVDSMLFSESLFTFPFDPAEVSAHTLVLGQGNDYFGC